jgi:hypothetical protein
VDRRYVLTGILTLETLGAQTPKAGVTMSYVVLALVKSETDVGLIGIEALRTYWSKLTNSQTGQIDYSFIRSGNEIEFRFRERKAAYSFARACMHYHNIKCTRPEDE